MGEAFGKFEKYAEIFHAVPTPAYVVMEELLRRNLAVLRDLQQETGAHVLLAQKAFSMFHFYPLIAEYLAGAAASGLFEARLAYEEMKGKENHVFSPAFKEADMAEIVKIADHIVFNSFSQWEKYGELALKHGCACGLRINPEHSTQEHAIYDPCSAGSRLGVKCGDFRPEKIEGLTGLHFHTLCEQGAEPLAETLEAVEEKFGVWLPQMKWINFGGGHHITREGYDIDLLKQCIMRMQTKYGLKVYITCPTSSRCRTVRPFWVRARQGGSPSPIPLRGRRALRAIRSAHTRSMRRLLPAAASSSATWRSIRW